MPNIDLTTLPGWSSLSDGSHNITIVAKAENYRDSEPSAAVSVEKAPQEYTDCITFTGESSDFTLAVGSGGAKEWNGTVEYSTDHNTWTTWNGTAISSVGKKLYLRGSGNTKFYTSKGARLRLSERAACSGNIQTLLEYSNPPTSIPASKCYRDMFYECRNLTQAPELPATTLAEGCYGYMFYGCTSLTTAPELPATTLTNYCYFYMFMDCRSLKISTTQSSEYPTAWRIPSSGTISSVGTGWNYAMLTSTGGTFTDDPSINTTYYGAWTSSAQEDELAGTWVFNDNAYAAYAADNKTFNVTFISNAQTFNSIIFNNNPMNGGMFYDTLRVVHPDDASHFIDQSYRTIAITSKLSEVTDGDTLLAWLQANATKQ